MAMGNSQDKDQQTRQERARATIEAYKPKYDTGDGGAPKGRHLDVDGVLARSLPKTMSSAKPFKIVTT